MTAMGTAETFWIDIEDSAGNRVGPGPITTAEGWQWSPRLDEAGTFRFRMPASDPAAAHLVEKRVVRCYAMMDGVKTPLGAGVIDEVALDVGDPSMLEVSGPDLLAELSQVSVKQLRICEQGWTLLTDGRGAVHRIRTYWEDGQWKHEDAPRYKMFDGDFETHDNILMYRYTYPNIGYLYVGHDARFDKARFTIIDRPNNVATTLHAQYFNGTDWTDLTIADGTESGGITMAQSGTVEWTRPTDWVRNTPTSTAGDWFWIRFTVGEGTSTLDSFRIEEVEVYADIPTKNGVNLIMQYAPAGWATSGYPATEAAHYIEFDGESILTALGALIEQGGQDGGGNPIREHFRLGSGRTLTWLGTTLTNTGLRAVDADGISAEGADELCLIQHLSRQRDASGVITRLYPFTADGIDLLLTTRSAPAGYTLVKGAPIPGQPWATASYLQRSSTLGVIEGWARFQDVGMQQGDSYLLHPEMAANALFDRALEYLRTHGAPQAFYDLTVAQVPIIILPGSTIDVVYHEYVDGYHAVDIDTIAAGEPLVILATTLEVDNSGAVTTALEVATIDRQAASDASVIAGSIRELRRIQGTTGGLSSYTTIHREVSGTAAITGGVITGVTIDNSPIGQLAPSTGAFTAIAVTNNIAVGGTVDGVDISAHAASDSAHHSPVTIGNTGLFLSGQDVSLRLATVSGLEISSGLRLADSIAGDGLTIASKILAVGVSGLGLSVGADAVTLTSSSNPGAAASILASDASGYLQLMRLGLNHAPGYPLHVAGATQQVRVDYNDSNYLSLTVGSDGAATLATVGASANLNLNPGGDVVFDPTGNDLLPATGYDLNLGSLQKKYLTLHAAELWVETLVAQNTIATIGGRILVGPTTTLVLDLADSASLAVVKHNEWALFDTVYLEANGKVEFAQVNVYAAITAVSTVGDWIEIANDNTGTFPAGRYFTIYGSTGNDGEWVVESSSYDGGTNRTRITVTGDITNATADGYIFYLGRQGVGPFTYRVTRNLDGSGANDWHAGDAVFNTGNVGDGFIDLYSVRGVKSGYGPTIVGNVRNSATFNDWSEHWAIGNLENIYGYGVTAYGAAFGRYANDSSFLTADATNGIRILKRAAGANTVLAQWAMDGAITIGEVAAGQSNVLISAGAIALRVNTTETIKLYSTGAAVFGQVATGKGNAYWNPSNNRLEFRGSTNGTVVQAYVDTDGSIVAGTGAVALNASGIRMTLPTLQFSHLKWIDSAGITGVQCQVSKSALSSNLVFDVHGCDAPETNATIQLSATSRNESQSTSFVMVANQSTNSTYAWALVDTFAIGTSGPQGSRLHVAGSATVTGGLNLGTATGAGAGEVLGKGAANYLRWVLENTQSNPNLVGIGVEDSAGQGIYMGRRGPNDTAYAGYGAAGDAYIYTGGSGRGFNILVPDSINGILRFYVGTNASGAPRVTFLRSGRVLIGTTTDDGVNHLQVNGSVKAVYTVTSWLDILDGVAAPATVAGWARIYVDSADGDLKIKFGDGTVKTIVTD